jgi:addiction module RelE/StbE family toxin
MRNMIIRAIYYEPGFLKDWKKLDRRFRIAAAKTEKLFRSNPLHPSLRLHALQGKLLGLWSISVTFDLRIIFKRMENGDIVFLSIGRHEIYNRK